MGRFLCHCVRRSLLGAARTQSGWPVGGMPGGSRVSRRSWGLWILSFGGNPLGPGGEDGGERVVMEGSQEVVWEGLEDTQRGTGGFLGWEAADRSPSSRGCGGLSLPSKSARTGLASRASERGVASPASRDSCQRRVSLAPKWGVGRR